MQLVLLAGELGEKYGQKHEYYNLQTPADAIKLLCINYPALKAELVQAHKNGVGYKVIQGGAAMGYDELLLPFGSKPLLVVPVITGSGDQATTQILIGVGLVAASFLIPGAGLFGTSFLAPTSSLFGVAATASTLSIAGTFAGTIGAALILGGTAQLLAPQLPLNRIRGSGTNVRGPGPDGITRGASGNQSYAFTGPANTVGTGTTLPVIYGRVITGSHLIAANLDIADNSDPLQTATQTPGLQTLKINGEFLTRQLKDCGGIKSKRGLENLTINSADQDRSHKMPINKFFGPGGNQPLKEGAIITSNPGDDSLRYVENGDRRKNIDVIFKITDGLQDFVAGPGSTRIDGFITYQITLTITEGDDVDIASGRITVQGLTRKSDDVIFGHRFKAPKVEKRGRDGMTVKVEIIEVGARPITTFELVGYGYKLLGEPFS